MLVVASEVADALAGGGAVVALESTLIAHGLPRPGNLDVARELEAQRSSWPKRDRVFTVQPRVLVDNNASDTFTVIEVNGRDRPGFLWEVTRELTRLSLQVSSAKISTYGEKVVDVFYVKNLFGHKVEHPQKLAEIRTALEAVLAKGNRTAPTIAAPTRRTRAAAVG